MLTEIPESAQLPAPLYCSLQPKLAKVPSDSCVHWSWRGPSPASWGLLSRKAPGTHPLQMMDRKSLLCHGHVCHPLSGPQPPLQPQPMGTAGTKCVGLSNWTPNSEATFENGGPGA